MKRKINYFFSKNLIDFKKILGANLWVIANQEKVNNHKSFERFIYIQIFLRTLYNSLLSTPEIKFPENKKILFFIYVYSRLDLDKHSTYYENVQSTSVCIFKKENLH